MTNEQRHALAAAAHRAAAAGDGRGRADRAGEPARPERQGRRAVVAVMPPLRTGTLPALERRQNGATQWTE